MILVLKRKYESFFRMKINTFLDHEINDYAHTYILFPGFKALSHDATSFMKFGFMKPVSPCDRAKNVLQGTLKSPVRLFLR